MWTGEDGDSLFEEGSIDLSTGTRGDSVGEPVPVVELSFQAARLSSCRNPRSPKGTATPGSR